jgi:hypothetical protein
MSQSSWLVAAIIPGVERHRVKKLEPDETALLRLLHRWRGKAEKAGRDISRIAVAYEAGRDGLWLARWLRAHGIDVNRDAKRTPVRGVIGIQKGPPDGGFTRASRGGPGEPRGGC